jgi:predicted esterase
MWHKMAGRISVLKGNRYHPALNIKPEGNCKGVVFFMHGLGDNGMGWTEGFAQMAHPNIRYIFPSANMQPVSLNMGMEMPSWFDIKDLSTHSDERYDIGKLISLIDYS